MTCFGCFVTGVIIAYEALFVAWIIKQMWQMRKDTQAWIEQLEEISRRMDREIAFYEGVKYAQKAKK